MGVGITGIVQGLSLHVSWEELRKIMGRSLEAHLVGLKVFNLSVSFSVMYFVFSGHGGDVLLVDGLVALVDVSA